MYASRKAALQREFENLAVEQGRLAKRMERLTREMVWQSKQAP
jgi:hypothetical protein